MTGPAADGVLLIVPGRAGAVGSRPSGSYPPLEALTLDDLITSAAADLGAPDGTERSSSGTLCAGRLPPVSARGRRCERITSSSSPPLFAIPALVRTTAGLPDRVGCQTGWERTGRHGEHGEMSIELYEAHVAAEEVDHLAQIARLLPQRGPGHAGTAKAPARVRNQGAPHLPTRRAHKYVTRR